MVDIGFSLANLREVLKDGIRNSESKIRSLRSVIRVFRPWYKVLFSYFFGIGGEVGLALGNKVLKIHVSKDNVDKLIFLAKIIRKCPEAYSIDDILSFNYSPN